MPTNQYKKLILEIAKEDDSDELLFSADLLAYALDSFQDRINNYEIEIACMEAEGTPGISGARKVLKRWKALAKKGYRLLNSDPVKRNELIALKQAALELGYKLIPNN